MTTPSTRVFPTPSALVIDVAEKLVERAKKSIDLTDRFTLFLSGGSTPKALHELLSTDAFRNRIDWSKVEIFFGDERCVAPTDERSNYRMAKETLFDRVPIPAENIHRMRGEIAPESAAIEYGKLLKQKFGDAGPDVLLLGMGDDGHTASLFPRTSALKETHHRCVANHVPYDYIPAGTSWRITITFPFINRSQTVIIMVTGQSKASRVSEVLEGELDVERLPIQGVQNEGELFWMLDSAAVEM